ncbi:MAG: ATP-dependent helicase [Thermodesulfovibrionales bacterium]
MLEPYEVNYIGLFVKILKMRKYRIKRTSQKRDISSDLEEKLNPDQYDVVLHDEGPMLVLAGAGTGKTTTVTYRVARLVRDGADPESMLLLTFTNKASGEMMKRAELLIGEDMRGLWGGTFHHLCNMILRIHAEETGYSRSYTIMDREDTRQMMKDCLTEVRSDRMLPKPAVLTAINSLSKNAESTVEETIETRYFALIDNSAEIGRVIQSYEERKRRLNLMDFDDLLVNAATLLNDNESICRTYQERFRYILVDEYQDTNHVQSEIVDLLASYHRNLMVVGDDAQSIYSFRGADFENIIRFPDRYNDAKIFKLTTNYRSSPEILELANNSISYNLRQFQKELRSVRYNSDRPFSVALNDIYEQAEFVVSRISDLLAEGQSLKNVAVLYRSHYQSMELQMELQRMGIPFEVRSGLRFFEQAHVKDILSYLRVIINPFDELSWKRILNLVPGIGNVTANKIFLSIYSKESPLDEIFRINSLIPGKSMDAFLLLLNTIRILMDSEDMTDPSSAIEAIMLNGYEQYLYNSYPNADSRVEDIEQIRQYASSYGTIEEFVSDLSLQTTSVELVNPVSASDDAVTLSTVHQAKGLEWNSVFIIGLNDGRFPSAMALKEGGEEEERRLFYVAVTRAKEDLFLCYTLTGGNTRGIGFFKPSRFIDELDGELYDRMYIER